ncbi:methylated-DNA--[protein]-cysteine S-methyltransferase [Canibacter zhuwentaonis]|uniref:methylated-DNA--[protein]-cysteine S-methyltransferase n=1 Tax=Canibacter zhuwentaonis TaxID=2837491 RepID=UPI0032B5F4B1
MIAENIAHYQTVKTPDGDFTVITASNGAVLASGWTADHTVLRALIHPRLQPEQFCVTDTAACSAVLAYYSGDPDPLANFAVKQHGGEFHSGVWHQMRQIPFGSTLSYAELARATGNAAAVRAAASACARNAAPLFVPCHRVVRTGGQLGGFAWGMELKKSILRFESLN